VASHATRGSRRGELEVAEDNTISVCFDGDDPHIEFPAESVTISIPITPIGRRLYRLDGIPFAVRSAAYGDVIEAVPGEGGRLQFLRVVAPSGWRTFDFAVPKGWMESERGQALIGKVEALGAHWELMFGGLLFVSIPPDLDFDPAAWLASA
jgi:uncharacterized protein DUF4265